jgi:hypothetical protein
MQDSCLFLDSGAFIVHAATVTALRQVKIYKFWQLDALQPTAVIRKHPTNNSEHVSL